MIDQRQTRLYQNILLVFLAAYLFVGVKTDLIFAERYMGSDLANGQYDLGIYERALDEALAGHSPYTIQNIGRGFLYPPTALLFIELIHPITGFYLKWLVFAVVDIALLVFMIRKITGHYSFPAWQAWYCVALFLGFAPFHELILAGQINMVTLFGIFIFYFWQEYSLLSGFGLSLAILTKVSPLILIGQLVPTRNVKVLLAACVWSLALLALSIYRYGIASTLDYPTVFRWVSSQFLVDNNSQSLVAKLTMVFGLSLSQSQYQRIEYVLMVYIFVLMAASVILTLMGNQPKEPAFIILVFGMTVMPNVMWYHHYVFLLLPILVWVGWKLSNPLTFTWCLVGMIIMQVDRFYLTGGLMIHLFVHISMLSVLAWQFKQRTAVIRLNRQPI